MYVMFNDAMLFYRMVIIYLSMPSLWGFPIFSQLEDVGMNAFEHTSLSTHIFIP